MKESKTQFGYVLQGVLWIPHYNILDFDSADRAVKTSEDPLKFFFLCVRYSKKQLGMAAGAGFIGGSASGYGSSLASYSVYHRCFLTCFFVTR